MNTRLAQGRLADVNRYLAGAQSAVKRAAALTQRLLAFSRRQTLDPRPADLNRLVAGMQDLVGRSVGPAVRFQISAANDLWKTFVDVGQLENALLNLCINARDAMPDGGALTIETCNCSVDLQAGKDLGIGPGQYVMLCVSDTGTGMSPDIIARAWDPFFTTKPMGQGTGLALSMVYGFAGQSGGKARIKSELGEGTTICLYLPRHLSDDLGNDDLPDGEGVHRALGSGTVLLVDDELLVRMVAFEVLEELGYEVIEAEDGHAALQVLEANANIDLLLTDVGLPNGMNGRQLAEAARNILPDLKVLFITGYAEYVLLNHGNLASGMQMMTKPFTGELLSQRVNEIIGDKTG